MQNFVLKPTPQDEYGYLQHSLDKSSSHRHHKAKLLLEYFLAVDDLRTNPDAQQIIAMLLVSTETKSTRTRSNPLSRKTMNGLLTGGKNSAACRR